VTVQRSIEWHGESSTASMRSHLDGNQGPNTQKNDKKDMGIFEGKKIFIVSMIIEIGPA